MSSDSNIVEQVTQNLSLRLSPKRKYKYVNSFKNNDKPNISNSTNPCCFFVPCCCCCCCCCCCNNPCLNYNYGSNDSQNKYNSGNNDRNSQAGMGSTNFQTDEQPNDRNSYNDYEQNQFNDFLKKLMDVESNIEDVKTDLAYNPDFNVEDAFRLFDKDDKGFITEEDFKNGLNLIGLNPTDQEIRLLLKRFDLQKNGNINYADFFDIVVPFEKDHRNRVENRMPNSCCPCRSPDVFCDRTLDGLGNLFNLIIKSEKEINNMRKLFGPLRLKLRDIFGLLDNGGKEYFTDDELLDYLQNNGLLSNNRAADLLFIRLDKNRNGKIDYQEVEDEIQTLY